MRTTTVSVMCAPSVFCVLAAQTLLAIAATSSTATRSKSGSQLRQPDPIAFVRRGAIWIVNADGTGLRRVLQLPEVGADRITCAPAWSSGGDRLWYGDNDTEALILVNLKGKRLRTVKLPIRDREVHRLHKQEMARRKPGRLVSYIVNYITFHRLLSTPFGAVLAEYEEWDDTPASSTILHFDGRTARRMSRRRMCRSLDVSSNGRWTAWVEAIHTGDDSTGVTWSGVYREDLIRKHRKRMYAANSYIQDVSLLPNGELIVGEATTDQPQAKLWVIQRDGTRQRLPDEFPTPERWSPDGRWFASSRVGEPNGLYVCEYATRRVIKLSQAYATDVVWTPDNRYLIVSRGDEGLWRISVPHGKAMKIAPDGWYPAVQPRRK